MYLKEKRDLQKIRELNTKLNELQGINEVSLGNKMYHDIWDPEFTTEESEEDENIAQMKELVSTVDKMINMVRN